MEARSLCGRRRVKFLPMNLFGDPSIRRRQTTAPQTTTIRIIMTSNSELPAVN
jgi:hypothetical protein